MKINGNEVGRIRSQQGRYIDGMPTFTLAGVTYDCLALTVEGDPEDFRSWEYGKYPKVEASVPLTDGGTVKVYGEASRWVQGHVIVLRRDDVRQVYWAWVPADNVRRVTDSEWDIVEYHRCPPERRPIRWGDRLPGFLPAVAAITAGMLNADAVHLSDAGHRYWGESFGAFLAP